MKWQDMVQTGLKVLAPICLLFAGSAVAQESLTDIELRERVRESIREGVAYLRRSQENNGSWTANAEHFKEATAGVTALAVLAQLNCDVPVDSDSVAGGLNFLRRVRPSTLDFGTYEASLLVMALVAADDGSGRDRDRIRQWTRLLIDSQVTDQDRSGLWGYSLQGFPGRGFGGDRSNGQYAVLALRDAANFGVNIERSVWERIHQQWAEGQNQDGGWGYQHPGIKPEPSTGSMTVAGLSTVAITMRMLHDDSDTDAEGRVDCCRTHPPPDALKKGRAWLSYRAPFSIQANPKGGGWHFYYLYGLERAGRLSGVRFFGKHDWYRAGARMLTSGNRQAANGSFVTSDHLRTDPVLTTSFGLLFLSKGLSRIVVNKLDYTSSPGREDSEGKWNQHHLDVPNLVDHIDSLPGWPRRLNSQVLTLSKLTDESAILDMNQAPVLYISGRDAPQLSDAQVRWMREYIDEGGFLFGQSNCSGGTFDAGFRDLVRRMFPDGDAEMLQLQADHPVFRSEYLLQDSNLELHGVDFGCRTPIIYSPEDHACYWHKWMPRPPRDRSLDLNQRIERSMRLGVNVIAYATGREPPEKLHESMEEKEKLQQANRSLTEIAQLRHNGGWDTAPRAVSNLLEALHQEVGACVSQVPRPVPVTHEALGDYPLAYMHGRYGFRLNRNEQQVRREYLSHGPVLIADACCGSQKFDESFRRLMLEMYPDHPLTPISADHEIYTEANGFDISAVRRRRLLPSNRTASMRTQIEQGPPQLEGILIDGHYVVIYSKYDLSCALENQASLACDGYVPEDAMKIAVNAVLFALYGQVISFESRSGKD